MPIVEAQVVGSITVRSESSANLVYNVATAVSSTYSAVDDVTISTASTDKSTGNYTRNDVRIAGT